MSRDVLAPSFVRFVCERICENMSIQVSMCVHILEPFTHMHACTHTAHRLALLSASSRGIYSSSQCLLSDCECQHCAVCQTPGVSPGPRPGGAGSPLPRGQRGSAHTNENADRALDTSQASLHFSDEDTEDQRGWETCPRSHSRKMADEEAEALRR